MLLLLRLGKLLSLLLQRTLLNLLTPLELENFIKVKYRRNIMPVASVSDIPTRFELKTLPGGFVTIRRMTYGEKLDSLEKSSKQEMTGDQRTKSVKVDLKNLIRRKQELDFSRCIVDHNLTWMNGDYEVSFDFKNDNTSFDRLDPRIAEEIDGYISNINNYDEDDTSMASEGKEVSTSDSLTELSEI
jgi:hypothetical protein